MAAPPLDRRLTRARSGLTRLPATARARPARQDPTIRKSEYYHDPATNDPDGQNVTPYVPGRPFIV